MIITRPRGIVTVTVDTDPKFEDDFNRWYDEEHLPERIACPGYLGARRFRAVEGKPKYLAVYELENLDALKTEQYLKLAKRTPWTEKVMGYSGTWTRNVYEEITAPGSNTRSWR